MSLQEHSEFINDVKQPLRKGKKGETNANANAQMWWHWVFFVFFVLYLDSVYQLSLRFIAGDSYCILHTIASGWVCSSNSKMWQALVSIYL